MPDNFYRPWMRFIQALRHRIAHWAGSNYCELVELPDALYLACVACGKMEKFAEYSQIDQIDRLIDRDAGRLRWPPGPRPR